MTDGVPFEGQVRLGGLPQQVLVRGTDAGLPLLLILHGGPGFAEWPLFTTHNAELEQHFLVAHWDQRGAGRSYSPDIPAESMTLRQFVDDTLELIDWLTERFQQQKVHLLGHSWGSLLAATVATERPEKLHTFVSVGQLVAGTRNELTTLAFTLRQAIERDNVEAITALREIEPRFGPAGGLSFAEIIVLRGWLAQFGGQVHGDFAALLDPVEPALRAEYFGSPSAAAAQEFCWSHLLPEIMAADLTRTARTFEIPVHFLVGRYDQNAPAELAAEYFELIEAPVKRLHWFEESAHLVPFEQPAEFNALLIKELSRPD